MNTEIADADLTELIFEPLVSTCKTHTFGYGMFGDFKIIIRDDNYVNAAKLCQDGGKLYKSWIRLDSAQSHISFLNKMLTGTDLCQPLTDVILLGGSNPIDKIVSGTYVHSDLITTIAQWISPKFAYMVSRIVKNYISIQHKTEMAKLERELALRDARLLLNEGIIVAKDDKIDKLMAQINDMREEQRALINMAKNQSDDITDSRIEIQRSSNKLDEVLEKNDMLIEKNDVLIEKNDLICAKLGIAVETRVPPATNHATHETLAVFAHRVPVGILTHYISCGQPATIKRCTAKYGEPVFQIKQQPNSKNLFQRIKEIPGIVVYDGSNIYPVNGIDSFTQALTDVNDEKYVVEIPKIDPYKALTVIELKTICTGKKIKGYSKCKRAELIKLIEDAGGL